MHGDDEGLAFLDAGNEENGGGLCCACLRVFLLLADARVAHEVFLFFVFDTLLSFLRFAAAFGIVVCICS